VADDAHEPFGITDAELDQHGEKRKCGRHDILWRS
jgi:hypothetical protein